jgi:hypothetical protein
MKEIESLADVSIQAPSHPNLKENVSRNSNIQTSIRVENLG